MALSPALGPLLVLPLHPGVGRAVQRLYETPEESRERRVIVTHWLGDSSFSLGTVRFIIDSGLELRSVSGVESGSGSALGCSGLWDPPCHDLPGWGPLQYPTLSLLQVYNPRIRAESQVLRPISRSQAESRMQRAAGSPPGETPAPVSPRSGLPAAPGTAPPACATALSHLMASVLQAPASACTRRPLSSACPPALRPTSARPA